MSKDKLDPVGVIRESYNIDGIGADDCRTIFLGWVLKVPVEEDTDDFVRQLLERHADEPADHPMTVTLRAALEKTDRPARRGGRSARVITQ